MGKGYTVTKVYIPSGDHRMKLLILSPAASKQPRENTPGILWIHGGGYAVGMAGIDQKGDFGVWACDAKAARRPFDIGMVLI